MIPSRDVGTLKDSAYSFYRQIAECNDQILARKTH
jgi:hypothetical protein